MYILAGITLSAIALLASNALLGNRGLLQADYQTNPGKIKIACIASTMLFGYSMSVTSTVNLSSVLPLLVIAGFATTAALCDSRALIIPDGCSAGIAATGFIYQLMMGGLSEGILCAAITAIAIGATTKMRVRKGKNEELGNGDIKMLLAISIACGPLGVCAVFGTLLLALIAAGIKKHQHVDRYPMAPYIAAATCITLVLGANTALV
ncbi:MAG: A24 family peptidase [Raoultibacter sp.]